jgi:hypothetical protein
LDAIKPASETPAPPARSTDGLAIWSAVCAGLGLTACFPLGIILGPLAFVVGRISRQRIAGSAGLLAGTGLATFGWVTGAILTLIWMAVVVIYVVRITMAVQNAS